MIKFLKQTNAPIQFACAEMVNVKVTDQLYVFDRLIESALNYSDLYQWTPLSEIPGVQEARRFFRSIGIDPTKRRPSSEALLNRAIKRKELYSVNTLVDIGNWCSLDFLLPTCIYDANKIMGDVAIRLGKKCESYLALNNREMGFHDRLVLADDDGPFGSPMTDSQRTAAGQKTGHAIIGIWAPLDYDVEKLKNQIELFANRSSDACGGKILKVQIISN